MRKFYILLTILFFGLFITTWEFNVFPGSNWFQERNSNKELTGYAFTAKLKFEYQSERAFNGDGYSIWVYDLDNETASNFINPNPTFYNSYPLKPNYRNKWSTKKWNKSPMIDKEKLFLDFATSEFADNQKVNKELQTTFDYIQKILKQKGSFYAYNYFMHGNDLVGDIDFFVISPNDKKLIIINSNT